MISDKLDKAIRNVPDFPKELPYSNGCDHSRSALRCRNCNPVQDSISREVALLDPH